LTLAEPPHHNPFMSWITEEIESIKQQKSREEAARDWTLRKSEILKGKIFQIWSAVMDQIKRDVSALEGEVEIIEITARTFTIRKKTQPTVDEWTASLWPGKSWRRTNVGEQLRSE
jgi:hypothetical protein